MVLTLLSATYRRWGGYTIHQGRLTTLRKKNNSEHFGLFCFTMVISNLLLILYFTKSQGYLMNKQASDAGEGCGYITAG